MAKGEIACFEQSFFLLQCFQESSAADLSKGGKGLKLIEQIDSTFSNFQMQFHSFVADYF